MKEGEVLEVTGYNPIARKRAPRPATRTGNHILGSFEDEQGCYHVI